MVETRELDATDGKSFMNDLERSNSAVGFGVAHFSAENHIGTVTHPLSKESSQALDTMVIEAGKKLGQIPEDERPTYALNDYPAEIAIALASAASAQLGLSEETTQMVELMYREAGRESAAGVRLGKGSEAAGTVAVQYLPRWLQAVFPDRFGSFTTTELNEMVTSTLLSASFTTESTVILRDFLGNQQEAIRLGRLIEQNQEATLGVLLALTPRSDYFRPDITRANLFPPSEGHAEESLVVLGSNHMNRESWQSIEAERDLEEAEKGKGNLDQDKSTYLKRSAERPSGDYTAVLHESRGSYAARAAALLSFPFEASLEDLTAEQTDLVRENRDEQHTDMNEMLDFTKQQAITLRKIKVTVDGETRNLTIEDSANLSVTLLGFKDVQEAKKRARELDTLAVTA